MANKKKVKKSEARIIVFLSQVPDPSKNVANISTKLNIAYAYLSNVLRDMIHKGWLFKHRLGNKTFYDLTKRGKDLVEQAKEAANGNGK